jgi:hypothetical protein
MPQFLPYSPEQALLLPPHVRDVLGADHICFFIHEVVERMDLAPFEQEYGEEGRRAYAPAMKRLERLKKSGRERLSRSDEDSRFLRDRKGFTAGLYGRDRGE